MKKIRLSVFTLLFACLFFAFSPAKADDPGEPCGGADIDSPCGGGGGGSTLPINTHIWYLVAAAGVIGATTVVRKTRKNKVAEA